MVINCQIIMTKKWDKIYTKLVQTSKKVAFEPKSVRKTLTNPNKPAILHRYDDIPKTRNTVH